MRRSLPLVVILPLVSILSWEAHPGPWTWMQGLGVALALPSFALWLTARVQLGDSFSVGAEARKLVTGGLYSRLRNPIYLFGSSFIAGLILFWGLPHLLLLAALVIIPVQVIRARREAAVLERAFGEEYRSYRARTWF